MSFRALVVFIFGLTLIRLFGRRAFGKHTPLDIILAIIIGSSLSRTLTGNAQFVPTLVSTAVLVICFWLMDHLAARWSAFGRLVKGDAVPLMQDGMLDRKRMRREGIGEGDLREAARRSGASGLEGISAAVLERNGDISTIPDTRDSTGT
jgi:uncharacterized membrane protein YcaP (DUF421 family)